MADDLISRQAAIDILMKEWKAYKDYPYVSHVRHGLEIAIAILENKLPSAQPEQREEAIIDPVDLVRNLADRIGIHQLYAIAWDMRGEPAQRTGRWIFGHTLGHSWMKCSECLVSQDGQTACFSYCPNCGCAMKGEDE